MGAPTWPPNPQRSPAPAKPWPSRTPNTARYRLLALARRLGYERDAGPRQERGSEDREREPVVAGDVVEHAADNGAGGGRQMAERRGEAADGALRLAPEVVGPGQARDERLRAAREAVNRRERDQPRHRASQQQQHAEGAAGVAS